jgi:glutaredoxin 3
VDSTKADITIYTTRICPYCVAAKRLLDQKGAPYREISVEDRADLRNWLVDTSGQQTVPQIFINGQSVGGYSELSGLQKAGKLDAMLATAPPADAPELRD